MRPAILALGANLGDPAAALQGAVDALAGSEGIRVITASSVYLTDPVGGPEQGVYSNAVVRIETVLTPEQLLVRVQDIEREFMRGFGVQSKQKGPGECVGEEGHRIIRGCLFDCPKKSRATLRTHKLC